MNAPLTHALEREQVAFRLNGEEVSAFADETIIQVADRLGVAAESPVRQRRREQVGPILVRGE